MPKNTGGRRASARSAAFRPGGNSSTNHKPLFDMNVMSLHARKNVNAAAVNAAAVTAAAVNATKFTKTTNTLILNANGNNAYIINHLDSVIANDNPTLSLRKEQTYIFENKSGGHPFQISNIDDPDSSAYNGLTEADGVLIFKVAADEALDILHYRCTKVGHYSTGMRGIINIRD